MNAAFADYVVPLHLTDAQFHEITNRRGFSEDHSFLATEGDRIAGFWFSSKPESEVGNRAYCLSAGVIPAYRRKGLLRRLFDAVLDKHIEDGGTGLQLEVIATNEAALRGYASFGYEIVRDLNVYKLENPHLSQDVPQGVAIREIELVDLPEELSSFFDTYPTRQNQRSAMSALPGTVRVVGAFAEGQVIGWQAVFPDGAAPELAVRRDWRRRGAWDLPCWPRSPLYIQTG
ncbi:GNAT family N-acetyltransferase [Roseibium sediminis]|uniref:GNAT family N-acetyltransferase n=1 Tax=Roseibium sediminis TaxID=1775174 RepID=UPI00137612CD|nr:GNAT family N-acetyltransferase [Roseibium sediminis]